MATLISDKFAAWEAECEERFNRLKANEEELNRIFAEIYDMVGEVPIEVEDKYVSVRKADLQREIRSLLSYAVGCMMGRYSLDEDGLILADQGCTRDDDIVAHTIEFLKAAYGEETLEANLRFIADALGGEGKPARDVIRQYFLKDFYPDHLQVYKKRPIYWMFDSGKKNGFKAITYMHRYTPDLLAKVRTDYVHETQERYRAQIDNVESELQKAEKSRRVALQKQLKKLQEQLKEASAYEEVIHHLADQMIEIDLDDGVKVNYAKFQDVLAKIK